MSNSAHAFASHKRLHSSPKYAPPSPHVFERHREAPTCVLLVRRELARAYPAPNRRAMHPEIRRRLAQGKHLHGVPLSPHGIRGVGACTVSAGCPWTEKSSGTAATMMNTRTVATFNVQPYQPM